MISIMRRFAKGNVEYCNNSIPFPFLPFFEALWKKFFDAYLGEVAKAANMFQNAPEKRESVELKSSKEFHCVQMLRCILPQLLPGWEIFSYSIKFWIILGVLKT